MASLASWTGHVNISDHSVPVRDTNGNLYIAQRSANGEDIEMFKSTDNGSNWSEVDAAGVPSLGPELINTFAMVGWESGGDTKIGVIVVSTVYTSGMDSLLDVEFSEFHCSDVATTGDTWNVVNNVVDNPTNAATFNNPQCGIERRSSDYMIVFPGDFRSTMGSDYATAWYGYGDDTGWTLARFDAMTSAVHAQSMTTAPSSVAGDAHMFATASSSDATLNAANSKSTGVNAPTLLQTSPALNLSQTVSGRNTVVTGQKSGNAMVIAVIEEAAVTDDITSTYSTGLPFDMVTEDGTEIGPFVVHDPTNSKVWALWLDSNEATNTVFGISAPDDDTETDNSWDSSATSFVVDAALEATSLDRLYAGIWDDNGSTWLGIFNCDTSADTVDFWRYELASGGTTHNRTIAATTTATPALSRVSMYVRSMDVTPTVTPAVSTFRQIYRSIASSTTLSPGFKRKFAFLVDASSTITPSMVAARFASIAIDAASTVTAGLSKVRTSFLSLPVTTTVTAGVAKAGQYFRSIAASSTVAPAIQRKFAFLVDAASTVTANMVAARYVSVSIDAVTTVAASLADTATFYLSLPVTTAVSVVASLKRTFYRSLAAATTVSPNIQRKFSFLMDVSTAVTAALANIRTSSIVMAVNTTVTPSLSSINSYYIAVSASTANTIGLAYFKIVKVGLDATSTILAALSRGNEITQIAMDALSTLTAGMTNVSTFFQQVGIVTAMTPLVGIKKTFKRLLAVASNFAIQNPLPGGGDSRENAIGKHHDALMRWLLDNEGGGFDSGEVVGALNQLNSTDGVEYEEARQTFLP